MSSRHKILISFMIAFMSAAAFFGTLALFRIGTNWLLNLLAAFVFFAFTFIVTLCSLNSLLEKSDH